MNSCGKTFKFTVFGESHADSIGVTVDGLPSGTEIDRDYIQKILNLRAPGNHKTATKRKEPDEVEFISGVTNGKTVGGSVCAIIKNTNTKSSDYSNLCHTPRPSHADYPAMIKYGENFDIRGGGQFSGRLTAPICIAGGIALKLLEEKGIKIGCHISSIGRINDDSFNSTEEEKSLIDKLNCMSFPLINDSVSQDMNDYIIDASEKGDSVGGVIECKITGLPTGLGLPMFSGIENAISSVVFGIPAVKGIEFGAGFEGSKLYGSEFNDEYYYDDSGVIRTRTNNSGGICGGMSTGMPVIFKTAVKPTPSISLVQNTVDLKEKKNTVIEIHGRHDPCIVPRACPVIRCAAATAILDLFMSDSSFSL